MPKRWQRRARKQIQSFLGANIEARAAQLAMNRAMSDKIQYGDCLPFHEYVAAALAHLIEKEKAK